MRRRDRGRCDTERDRVFPARNIAYGVAADGKSYRYKNFSTTGTSEADEIVLPEKPQRVLYKSRRVPEEFDKRFLDAGYKTIELDAYSDGLLKVISGEAAGYIANDPQMRDILIGPVIAAARSGFMCDWHSNEIQWPKKGRIRETFYGNRAHESELRALLAGH